MRRTVRRGFSLVELLAVVLILAVLAALAVPLYINSRKSSAARACKGNIAMIASAESAYALRNGAYAATTAALVGQPEGLSAEISCPLGTGAAPNYTCTIGGGGALTIACVNAATHELVVGPAGSYSRTMTQPAVESVP